MTGSTPDGWADRILHGHIRRIAEIDPEVAPAERLSTGNPILDAAIDPSAMGEMRYRAFGPEDEAALWGSLHRYVLEIRVCGTTPAQAFGTVLSELVAAIFSRPAEPDSSVSVTWPIRDVECAGQLVRNGFCPVSVLAMKMLTSGDRDEPRIRPAGPGDVERIVAQAEELHRLDISLGALPMRPDLPRRLEREILPEVLRRDGTVLVWISENGDVAGFIQVQPPQNAWIESRVRVGPAGYMQRLYVDRSYRNSGVGGGLVAAAERRLVASGAEYALLHHSIHNPYGAPFWIRRGFRSVSVTWTRSVTGC